MRQAFQGRRVIRLDFEAAAPFGLGQTDEAEAGEELAEVEVGAEVVCVMRDALQIAAQSADGVLPLAGAKRLLVGLACGSAGVFSDDGTPAFE